MLEAKVHVSSASGDRVIAFADFHRLPGDTPQRDTNLNASRPISADRWRLSQAGGRGALGRAAGTTLAVTQGRVWAISKAVFFRPPRCGESENGAYLNRRPCTTPSCGNSTRGNALARAPRAPVRIKQSRGGEPGAYLGLADAQDHPYAPRCPRRGARSAFTRDRAARPSATRVPPPAVAVRSPAPESLNSRLCMEFLSSC